MIHRIAKMRDSRNSFLTLCYFGIVRTRISLTNILGDLRNGISASFFYQHHLIVIFFSDSLSICLIYLLLLLSVPLHQPKQSPWDYKPSHEQRLGEEPFSTHELLCLRRSSKAPYKALLFGTV